MELPIPSKGEMIVIAAIVVTLAIGGWEAVQWVSSVIPFDICYTGHAL